jgi:hypothetical protein
METGYQAFMGGDVDWTSVLPPMRTLDDAARVAYETATWRAGGVRDRDVARGDSSGSLGRDPSGGQGSLVCGGAGPTWPLD